MALTLDPGARVLRGGTTIVGGDPPRVLTLSAAGARVASELLAGGFAQTPAAAALAGRLVRAGIAHPRPHAASHEAAVTVVIPVRDRAEQLERCLTALGAPGSSGAHRATIVVDDGSSDHDQVAAVCERHGAALIRRARSGGPAAARNAALSAVATELVAFVDSDCAPQAGWLTPLCGALDDPVVAAAAPRITPLRRSGAGPVARFAAVRCPLDMGARAAEVRPGGRVSYVPTAALLVRRDVLGKGFDERLRYGEDVDLIWRLLDAGHAVRYEPAAVVWHAEPSTWRALMRRRFAYGCSAAALAERHPERLHPVWLYPLPTAVLALSAARRPRLAAGAAGVYLARTVRTLGRAGVPAPYATTLAARALADSAMGAGRGATMLVPAALAAGLLRRRTRPAAAALLLAEPLRSWVRQRPQLDPLRWTALAVADDLAYGAGVWAGAVRARTLAPLKPKLVFRRHSDR